MLTQKMIIVYDHIDVPHRMIVFAEDISVPPSEATLIIRVQWLVG